MKFVRQTFWSFAIFLIVLIIVVFSLLVNSFPSRHSFSHLRSISTAQDSLKNKMQVARAIFPEIIYGTAWKKDLTQTYVELAVKSGFRAIDTACQPKHYYEKGVGDALVSLYAQKIITREDIFLQTKYTSIGGQDPNNIPYDRHASLREQVLQSFQKSLENLQTTYLDSLVMHSPMETIQDTLTVWRVFEELQKAGQVKYLGLSNTYDLLVLQAVYDQAEIKPTFLQNRFHERTHYDIDIRQYCILHQIHYQSFWTLSANPHILKRYKHQKAHKNTSNLYIVIVFRILVPK